MFFQGVVEDNNDPQKLGRVRVRIEGKHTENRSDSTNKAEYLPTEDLPWAIPVFPVTSEMISGIGSFSIPKQGSVVLVSFLDADELHPFYIGTLPKIPLERPDFSKGYSDPASVHPTADFVNKSPIPKNAQGEDERTVGAIFGEPALQAPSAYPLNKVIRTSSGDIVELDEAGRICIYHNSGAAVEIQTDGKVIIRSHENVYEVSEKKNYLSGKTGVEIDGGTGVSTGDGVVTKLCLCAFTGKPHPDFSSNVKASK